MIFLINRTTQFEGIVDRRLNFSSTPASPPLPTSLPTLLTYIQRQVCPWDGFISQIISNLELVRGACPIFFKVCDYGSVIVCRTLRNSICRIRQSGRVKSNENL